MKSKIVSWLVIGLVNVGFSYQLYPVLFGERVVESVMPSVVRIEVGKKYLGSGVFVSRHGHILTCAHLFAHGENLIVVSNAEDMAIAHVVVVNPEMDLALIKVDKEHTPSAHIRLRRPKSGEEVYVIGHPFGLSFTVTKGIVSGHNRFSMHFTQTDAVLNPGNSGGPVFDWRGNLIGIAQATTPGLPFFTGQGLFAGPERVSEFLKEFTL